MKLAEALLIRSDLQEKLQQLEIRLKNNATVQEGEKPVEDPVVLLKEYNSSIKELEKLIAAINLANARIEKDGVTMTELLAKRDCLKKSVNAMHGFLESASSVTYRARASEIKILSALPVSKIQKDLDALSADLRRLEITIQELNWISEI